MFNETTKVVMIVDVVSPTPYALLRRVKNFEYRDDDNALQQFANQDDPVRALTDECRRVLKCISSANESTVSTTKASTGLKDATWSRFEDMGFGSTIEESDGDEDSVSMLGPMRHAGGLKSNPRSPNGDLGRPTTPSWADFLSSGFADENANRSHMLLPPDKVLPPIQTTARGQSSQSHRRNLETESTLEPGELASINKLDLDDSFWWVWISSLAGEEPTSRKAVFGRCALIETIIKGGKWMIMEEQVKGAAPEPAPGAYIAEKKGFFGFTTRKKRRERRKSGPKKDALPSHAEAETVGPTTRTNVSPDLQARIHAAATELQRRNQQQGHLGSPHRRGRQEEIQDKTQSVMTLQPMLMSEASQAMKWASQYDKNEIRAKYLGDNLAAKGSSTDLLAPPVTNGMSTNASSVSLVRPTKDQELPLPPPPPEKVPLPASPAIVPFRETPATKVPLPASPAGTPLKETAPTKLPLPASPAVTPLKVIPPARVPLPESPAGTPLRETPALKDPPLSRLPLPSPPQDDALVRTPSPTPPNDSPLPPQPPTPPKSEKMSQPFAPAPATQHPAMREPLSPPPAFTALPESPSPAASPAATPTLPSEPQSSIPKKPGLPSPQERAKLIKKRKPGIKGMFGGKAGKEPPMTPAASPIESGPAVAAARAALAGRDKTQLNGSPIHQVVTQVRQEPPSPAPVASRGPTTPPPEPAYQAPQAPPSNQASQHPPRTDSIPEKATVQHPDGAPKTRRDEEYENLSRVDTNEREQADREFSTFDQGPLVEQPAFVPSESPETPRVVSPLQEQQTSLPAHAATTQQVEPEGPMEKIESKDFTREISPVQDRWAQIRKNAAERAARQSEEQSRKGEVRNSVDSETSGEESKSDYVLWLIESDNDVMAAIESRVARIKARVAELTGNIDAPRR